MEETPLVVVSTRLPADLHARFAAICDAERRSMSARVLMLVEAFVEETEQALNQGV